MTEFHGTYGSKPPFGTEGACPACPTSWNAVALMATTLSPGSVKTSVYVALDSASAVLYIGITSAGLPRFDQHAVDNAHWWLQSDRLVLRHFHCRHDALDVEAFLIRALNPEWNSDRPQRNQERGRMLAREAGFGAEFDIVGGSA